MLFQKELALWQSLQRTKAVICIRPAKPSLMTVVLSDQMELPTRNPGDPVGVGAMVVGGIWALIKLIKPLLKGIQSSIKAYSKLNNNKAISKEEMDFPINFVFSSLIILLIPVFFLYLDVIKSIPIAIK